MTTRSTCGTCELGSLPFLRIKSQYRPSQNLFLKNFGRKKKKDIRQKKLTVQGLIRVITDEARLWKQAGAQISLVDQYGGTPFDTG
jgi:hypothetical protein